MSVRRLLPVPVLLAALAGAWPGALAFSPGTRALIVHRAMTLMPDALERQMARHARSLYRGALDGVEQLGPGYHALDPGDADLRLERAVVDAVRALDEQRPMREVVARFGRIARVASDLAFALNVGPDDPREADFYGDFARFVESRQDRIRITFGGFSDPWLARDDIRGFGRSVAASARRDYGAILASYHPPGRERLPGDFDDRSVAFAAASLELSLAVTATARAWLYAWHRAHGDLQGAPIEDPSEPFGPMDSAAGASREERTR